MGARPLEARLTARLLALGGAVLVAVGVAAVVVTDRVLDASDTDVARNQATSARDMLSRELDEGDSVEQAIREVMSAAEAQGGRLAVRSQALTLKSAIDLPLGDIAAGRCVTLRDGRAAPWRACATGDAATVLVAAIPIAAHRAVVTQLSRGMAAVLSVALLALWLAVRSALREPIAELTALVGWAARIVDNERPLEPPPSQTREIAHLEAAFVAVVGRLIEALARERANSAHIAHELRTPLTAIVAELDQLRTHEEAVATVLLRIRGDAKRLSDVIDALLVLADGGRAAPDPIDVVNLADLARDFASAVGQVDAPDEALVLADERLVSLALRNLLDNARKYGHGARILRVSREGSKVRMAVVDRGPGIHEAARRHMFDRYWRGSADGEGRGLGLALVRAVAERHGGSAEAHPGPDGLGLDVSLTLGRLVGWHEEPQTPR